MNMRRLLPLLVAFAAALAVALSGCGGGSGASTEDANPADATPKTAVFYGVAQIQPSGDLKTSVDAAGKKIAQGKSIGSVLDKAFEKSFADKDSGKLDYKKDIKPWLGKRAAVFVSGMRNGKPDFGVLVSTKDGDKAAEALKKSEKNDSSKETEKTYNGQKYSYTASDRTAQGVVKGWLIAGTEPAFRAAVDAIKGSGLSKVQAYKDATSKVSSNGLMTFYADVPRLVDVIAESGGAQASIAIGQLRSLPQFKQLKPIAAAVTVTDSSIRFETPARASNSNAAADAVAKLPGDAWLALAAPTAGDQVRKQIQATEKLPGGATITQFKSLLRQQTGLDLDRDLLDWIGGFSISAGGTGLLDLNASVVIDSNDPGASATAVKKFGVLAKRAGEKTVPIKGGFAVKVTNLPAPVYVAARGNKVVVAYGKNGVARALNPPGQLSSSQAYKDAQAAIGGGKPAFLISMPAIVQLAQNFGASNNPGFQQALPYLKAFTSITSGVVDQGGQKLTRAAVGLK